MQSLEKTLNEKTSPINIVVYQTKDNLIKARRINTPLSLSEEDRKFSQDLFNQSGRRELVIPYNLIAENKLLRDKNPAQIVLDPMKILFVQSHGVLNNYPVTSFVPSTGIWKLAHYLSSNLPYVDVRVLDPNLLTKQELDETINSLDVQVLGFSIIPVNLKNDLKLITQMYRANPNPFIIAGGVQSQALNLVNLVNNTSIDFISQGSGIPELPNVLNLIRKGNIKSKQDLRTFNNLRDKLKEAFPNSSFLSGQAYSEELREFIPLTSTDVLHPRSYEYMNHNTGISLPYSIRISNNCKGNCPWCAVPHKENLLFGSAQEVYEDIKKAKDSANKVIAFNDNDLGDHSQFMIDVFNIFIRNHEDLELHGKSRIETVQPEFLEAYARAGGVRLSYGIESFDDSVRRKLKPRSFTIEKCETIIQRTLDFGIIPEINLIWFTPNETVESLTTSARKSINWLEKGAWIYSTHGLYASLGAPATERLLSKSDVQKKIEMAEIFYEGMTGPVLMPSQYKSSPNIFKIRKEVERRKTELMQEMSTFFKKPIPIHVEGVLTPYLISDLLGFNSLGSHGLYNRASLLMKRNYVSI